MFAFSDRHNWKSDLSVEQILVFSTQERKELFNNEYINRVAESGEVSASDLGIGATYKLMAARNPAGTYKSIIVCGELGTLLWEGFSLYIDATAALNAATDILLLTVTRSFNKCNV
jgi:hypothetical protein